MNMKFNKKLMEIAMELGIKSIGEYGVFVRMIEEFKRGKRRSRGFGKSIYFKYLVKEANE